MQKKPMHRPWLRLVPKEVIGSHREMLADRVYVAIMRRELGRKRSEVVVGMDELLKQIQRLGRNDNSRHH